MKHVKGKQKGDITLYAISTCAWCKKTKKLLQKLNVSYDYVDMDKIDSDEKKKMENEVKKCNPQLSYPTVKINDDCIIGFKENEIKEAVEK